MIYVASSWRNERQPSVVRALLDAGLEVYDFRKPRPGDNGFAWEQVDPDWETWSAEGYLEGLAHPRARAGFASDMAALRIAAACVLVLPSGNSAHIEAGWCIGVGKPTAVLLPDEGPIRPDLMYRMADIITPSLDAVVGWAG